jgi:hypothetical protein
MTARTLPGANCCWLTLDAQDKVAIEVFLIQLASRPKVDHAKMRLRRSAITKAASRGAHAPLSFWRFSVGRASAGRRAVLGCANRRDYLSSIRHTVACRSPPLPRRWRTPTTTSGLIQFAPRFRSAAIGDRFAPSLCSRSRSLSRSADLRAKNAPPAKRRSPSSSRPGVQSESRSAYSISVPIRMGALSALRLPPGVNAAALVTGA